MSSNMYDEPSPLAASWLNNDQLKIKIENGLKTFKTDEKAPKARKKIFKKKVCEILGFDIPKIFKKTKPMYPNLNFDLYIQQSHNLQIWNEPIDNNRRYVIVKINENGEMLAVKVVMGTVLAPLDTTGKLTTKLQAILNKRTITTSLNSLNDTLNCQQYTKSNSLDNTLSPSSEPVNQKILPISEVFDKLKIIVNGCYDFTDPGSDRLRGDKVHQIYSSLLGFTKHSDDGQFPDIKNQLLEIKLQTSPTIDIGLESPNSKTINSRISSQIQVSNSDVRYAVIYAEIENNQVKLKNIVICTGEDFFSTFPQMQGNVVNGKYQLPLPKNFFD
ncbi:hypothetical protein [Aliarcobacter cryaerophilus]|uniref:hypothetical protein n=1 Tax=Aliarcobacter cryaerophilus TaxID=28198 RepID=UPI003DA286EC